MVTATGKGFAASIAASADALCEPDDRLEFGFLRDLEAALHGPRPMAYLTLQRSESTNLYMRARGADVGNLGRWNYERLEPPEYA